MALVEISALLDLVAVVVFVSISQPLQIVALATISAQMR